MPRFFKDIKGIDLGTTIFMEFVNAILLEIIVFWGSFWELVGSLLDVFFEYWGPLGQLWLRS